LWRVRFQGITSTRQARIGHEILLRVERFFAFLGCYPPRGSVRQYFKTLLVVHDVAEHNLAKHLFVNGWVGDRNQCLNPSVKIAGHQIGRRYEYDGIIGRQAAAIAKAIDAAVLEEAPDDRLYPDVIRQT